jgi:hypothetical protein
MIDLGPAVVIEKVVPSGWSLNMVLVRLGDGRVLVHSPTWHDDPALVEASGRPAALFAPNHFHHLGLKRFRAQWPDAIGVASDGARPRLAQKGHALEPLAAAPLPAGARWLEPPGLKNGEAWLALADGTWIVCDAFFHCNRPVTGLTGFVLRRTRTVPGLCVGQTFRWLGVRDRRAYREWLLDTLRATPPRRVIPSHGEILDGDDVPDRLRAVAEARL